MKNKKENYPKSLAQLLADPDGWPGLVYFIQGGEGTPIKVGYTNDSSDRNLSKRLLSLQTGHPDPLTVVHIIDPAFVANEKALHKILAPWRTRETGEWFESHAVNALIETLNYAWPESYRSIPQTPWLDVCESIESEIPIQEKLYFQSVVIREQLTHLDGILNAPALPLLGWLLLQEERDDPIGDLARDAKQESSPFETVGTLQEYARKLPEHTWNAIASSYFECFWDTRELGQALIPGDPLPWELRRGSRVTL